MQDVIEEEKIANNLCKDARVTYGKIDDAVSGINCSGKTMTTAESRNLVWESRGYDQPPYKPNTLVMKITTNSETKLVRVYSDVNKANGTWVMRASDIEGLTPTQIKDKFALPALPTHICDVTVPSGTNVFIGIAGKNTYGSGGGIQFEFESFPADAWFSNMKNLLP